MSAARTSAIRFSKPSPCLFEKGRLLGSAHTRSADAWLEQLTTIRRPAASNDVLRKREYIDRASFGGVIRQIFHGADKAQCRSFIRGIQPARHNGSCPSPNTVRDRDVLFAVRCTKTHRLADNSRSGAVLPQQFS